jgi:hypothetical protein
VATDKDGDVIFYYLDPGRAGDREGRAGLLWSAFLSVSRSTGQHLPGIGQDAAAGLQELFGKASGATAPFSDLATGSPHFRRWAGEDEFRPVKPFGIRKSVTAG